MDKTILGKRLKEARISKNYTQEQLAEEASISVEHMSALERGLKFPSIPLLVKISNILGVSTDTLLRDELESGKMYVYHEITEKMESLTPKQRITCVELLEVYIRSL